MNEWIITTAITLGIGVITYFLKRTMNQVDNQGAKIQEMFNQMQTKAEQKEQTVKLEGQIQKIRDDYTPKEMHEKDFDECRMDIKQIKAEYLTKDDFIRERMVNAVLDTMNAGAYAAEIGGRDKWAEKQKKDSLGLATLQ